MDYVSLRNSDTPTTALLLILFSNRRLTIHLPKSERLFERYLDYFLRRIGEDNNSDNLSSRARFDQSLLLYLLQDWFHNPLLTLLINILIFSLNPFMLPYRLVV